MLNDYAQAGENVGTIIGMVIVVGAIIGLGIFALSKFIKANQKPVCDFCDKTVKEGFITLTSKNGKVTKEFCDDHCKASFLAIKRK